MVDMKPRSPETSSMGLRQVNTAEINPRFIQNPTMDPRENVITQAYYFRYNETNVMYNQSLVSYNYHTSPSDKGRATYRLIGMSKMRGR